MPLLAPQPRWSDLPPEPPPRMLPGLDCRYGWCTHERVRDSKRCIDGLRILAEPPNNVDISSWSRGLRGCTIAIRDGQPYIMTKPIGGARPHPKKYKTDAARDEARRRQNRLAKQRQRRAGRDAWLNNRAPKGTNEKRTTRNRSIARVQQRARANHRNVR